MTNITQSIRDTFIAYFKKQDHTIVPASSVVPTNDPTLMFTNSGMVQFKNYFTGAEKAPFPRAATIQKSVRAGGKHNDLDNVGYTVRHHTFFEMLGNFSFGDYFKEKAIFYAWELLTKEMKFDKDKLLVTVFHTDEEAIDLWKKIAGFSDDRIIKIATKDNFWQMGDTGPCGPCSEIFYDHGDKYAGGPPGSPDEDGDRFIEIWNIVFDQFEDLPDGKRIEIPQKCIDTGAGLERWSAILHGTNDNFEIDMFKDLIATEAALLKTEPHGDHKHSLRVIADHVRSSAFLLADGVYPSNEGRGYVLRRIMRRAMRHAHLAGATEPIMYQLVPTLIKTMGVAYPELKAQEALITQSLKLEEERFLQTLSTGLKLLNTEMANLSSGQPLPGEVAFKLYDTYGFPFDLTQDALRDKGFVADEKGFEAAMQQQKELAKKSWVGSGDTADEKVWFTIAEKQEPTEFLGYTGHTAEALVHALVKDNKPVSEAREGEEVWVLTNQTPFYGEKGGQVGDTGSLTTEKATLTITDTQIKAAGRLIVHKAVVVSGMIHLGDTVHLAIDTDRRRCIQAHHSCTHLLQAALQQTLGKNVHQKGSWVAPDRFRFDFMYPQALTPEEITTVESLVNRFILQNLPGATRLMSQEAAKKLGAMALFNEKYGDEVRVVSFGDLKTPVSCELCGGTHVSATGEIGLFKILSETGIAAGIRRIEGVAGWAAYQYVSEALDFTHTVLNTLKAPEYTSGVAKLEQLQSDKKRLEKDVSDLRKKLATGQNAGTSTKIGDITLTTQTLTDVPVKELKPMVAQVCQNTPKTVAVFFVTDEDKVSVVAGVSKDLTASAVDIVKALATVLGGAGGGGRPDLAQAGGTKTDAIPAAIEKVKKMLA